MADRHLTDTSADALQVMSALYAKMTPEQKLRRVRDLTLGANRLALAGLRRRHPDDTELELRLRLAHIRLGAQLFAQAYPDSAATGGT